MSTTPEVMSATAPPIKNKTLVTKGTLYNHRRFHVNSFILLNPGEVKDYDIAEQLGPAGAAMHNFNKTEVQVLVEDTDPDSIMRYFYVDASAVTTIGIRSDGKIRVLNHHTEPLTLWVRVIVHLNHV